MRRLSVLCVLCTILVTAVADSLYECAHMTPQSPVILMNNNLTAFCILNETCLQQRNHVITAQELFWKVGSELLPDSQYTVLNDSVSTVTFQPTLSMHNTVSCSFKAYGQTEVTLHQIYFTLGYPPEKPENLTCVCYNENTLTCTWDLARPNLIPTTYTLKQYWLTTDLVSNYEMMQNLTPPDYPQIPRPSPPRRTQERKDCVAEEGKNFCTLRKPDFILHISTEFQVEAVNPLGKAVSDRLEYSDLINIVKPDPPHIVSVTAMLERVLKIQWKNPLDPATVDMMDLMYNIRYRPVDSSEWSEVPAEDLRSTRTSFILQSLHPYTGYVISMRCKLVEAGFWSEWSPEHTGNTSESTPSQGPELWRKMSKSDSGEKREVQLMWKDLKSHANGIILGYNVTVKKGPEVIDSFIVKDTVCDIRVPGGSYDVLLTAFNSRGSSPVSRLTIPSTTGEKVVRPADLMNLRAFPRDGRLWVEWSQQKGALGYVLEWCSNSETMDCSVEWQREPSNVAGTFLRGDIKPFVHYLIRLIPLYADGRERSSDVEAYLQQGAPEVGPVVKTNTVGKNWITLQWKPIPLQQRRGFITNYTITFGELSSPASEITVNASVTEYTMKSLSAKTMYHGYVTANTERGGTPGAVFNLATAPFDNGEVEAIVVSSCLGFLVFILVLCFLFCNKKEQIKKHIWPNVPDPSKSNIAQWSPQTPSRHEAKRHPFQEGPFTDVSVVEITGGDKKFDSDPEPKCVDVIKKNTSEGLSSGIGGSSCLSSPRLSVSDSEGLSSAQNTSGTVQYSTVIMGGYQGQTPMFSRSESTQPLLISEERPDEQTPQPEDEAQTPSQYFKQNFTAEDGAGRIQEPPPSANHTQDPPDQVLHLAGFSQGLDNLDFTAGHNVTTDDQPPGGDPKTYLPQTVRQGGYLPQ